MHEFDQLRYELSACMPVFGGWAAWAAASACLHKSLAAWLASHVFVNASHINSTILKMPCAEPWSYDAVVHKGEQTCHSTRMSLEPGSVGAKAVSFLPSRSAANLTSGVEHLPKLAAERLALVFATAAETDCWLVPPTGFPVLSITVTEEKSVFSLNTALNAGKKFNCMKLTS